MTFTLSSLTGVSGIYSQACKSVAKTSFMSSEGLGYKREMTINTAFLWIILGIN